MLAMRGIHVGSSATIERILQFKHFVEERPIAHVAGSTQAFSDSNAELKVELGRMTASTMLGLGWK